MTLYAVIKEIERVAAAQTTINMIVENDVWKLNSVADAEYGVFAFRQTEHSGSVNSSLVRYGFEFYYIDRLLNDKSNMIEVQSVGVQTLDNILVSLSEAGIDVAEYRIVPFYQRFADECSGAMCILTIAALRDTMCEVEVEDKQVRIV